MTENPPSPLEVAEFKFKLYAKLKVFTDQNELKVDRPFKLVASASKYGLVFVGIPSGIQCIRCADIIVVDDRSRNHCVNSYKRRSFQLGSQPTHIDVSCDHELLGVTLFSGACVVLQVYSVKSFGSAQVKKLNEVRLSTTPGVTVTDLQWNPGVPNMIAAVMSDGSASVVELKEGTFVLNSIPPNAQASCLCWSPKGKQVVIGAKNGTLIQYKPELKAMKTCEPPKLGPPVIAVVSVHWLSNFQFIVVYKDANDPSARSCVVVVNTPKNAPPKYVFYEDLFFENETSRPEHFFIHQPAWLILVLANINCMDVNVLKMEGDSWVQWMQEEGFRAELPLTEERKDVFNVGISVDYSSVRQIPIGENLHIGPMPTLLMYAHNGVLCLYDMINAIPNAPSLCQPPSPFPDPSGLQLFVEPQGVASSPVSQPAQPKIDPKASIQLTSGQPLAPGGATNIFGQASPAFGGLAKPATTAPVAQEFGTQGLANTPQPSALANQLNLSPFSQRSPAQANIFGGSSLFNQAGAGTKPTASPGPQPPASEPKPQQLTFSPQAQQLQPNVQAKPNQQFLFGGSSLFNQAGGTKPGASPGPQPPVIEQPKPQQLTFTSQAQQQQPDLLQQKPNQQPLFGDFSFSSALNSSPSGPSAGQERQVASKSALQPIAEPKEEKKLGESGSGTPDVSQSPAQPGLFSLPAHQGGSASQATPANLLNALQQKAGSLSVTPFPQSHLESVSPIQTVTRPEQEKSTLTEQMPSKEDAPAAIDPAEENKLIIQQAKDLISEFEDEMELMKSSIKTHLSQTDQIIGQNGLNEKINKLLNDIEAQKKFENRMKEGKMPDLAFVNALGSNLMEMFGWYEKIKAREKMSKSSGYIELMESQDLDPVTKHYLKSIDKHAYYLESQIKLAKSKLGTLWDTVETTMDIPAMEAIYQSLVAHHNVLAAKKLVVENHESTLKKINKRRLHRSNRRKVGDLELSTLADRLLDSRLEDHDISMEKSLKDLSNNYIALSNNPCSKPLNEDKVLGLYDWHKYHKVIKTKVTKSCPTLPVYHPLDNSFSDAISPTKQSTPFVARYSEKRAEVVLPRKNILSALEENKLTSPEDRVKFNSMHITKGNEGSKIEGINITQSSNIDINVKKTESISTPASFKNIALVETPQSKAGKIQTTFNANTLSSSGQKSIVSSSQQTPLKAAAQPVKISSSESVTNVTSSISNLPISKASYTPTTIKNQQQTGRVSISKLEQMPGVSVSLVSSPSPTSVSASSSGPFGGLMYEVADSSKPPQGTTNPPTSAIFASFEKLQSSTTAANTPTTFSFAISSSTSSPSSVNLNSSTPVVKTPEVSSKLSESAPIPSSQANIQKTNSTTSATSFASVNFGSATPKFNFGSSSALGTALPSQAPNTSVTNVPSTTSASTFWNTAKSSPASIFSSLPTTSASVFTASPSTGSTSESTTEGTVTTSSSIFHKEVLTTASGKVPNENTTSPVFAGTTSISTSSSIFGGASNQSSSIFGKAAVTSIFDSAVSSNNATTTTSSKPSLSTTSIFGSGAPLTTANQSIFSNTSLSFSSPAVASTSSPSNVSAVSTTTMPQLNFGIPSTSPTSSLNFGVPSTTSTSVFGGAIPAKTTTSSDSASSLTFGSLSLPAATSTVASSTTSPALTVTSAAIVSTATVSGVSTCLSSTPATTSSTSIFAGISSTLPKTTAVAPNISTTSATSAPPLFGSATSSSTSLFGNASTTSSFGSFATPTTSSQPFFSNTTGFGATTTSSSIFGGTPISSSFGATTPSFGSTSTSNTFGVAATSSFGTSTTNAFAVAATTSSFFGSPSVFATTTTTPSFGSTNDTSSIFGATSALSSASFFGSSTTTSSNVFGANQSPASIFGGSSSFGQPATTSSSASFFGKTICSPTSTTNVFGTSNVFGQTTTTTASASSIFGGANAFQQKPAFGQGNLFGQTTSSPGNFGSSGGSIFGGTASFSSPTTPQTNLFQSGGTGSFSGAGNTGGPFSSPQPGQQAFGAPPAFQSPRPFGGASASPGFGSPPAFGSSPVFGGSPSFNSSPNKVFGATATTALPAFGSPTQPQSSTFENLAQQETVSFGNLAQQQGFQSPTFGGSSFSSWR